VDKCIECGFCEHHCPSRDVTLTPRQRIQVRRHLKQLEVIGDHETYAQLLSEYQYAGLDTCATDGLCQMDCPVSINTGDLVKRLRKEQHGSKAKKAAMLVAHHFSKAETLLRFALQTGVAFNKLFGRQFMPRLTEGIQNIMPAMPQWWNELGLPPKRISNTPEHPAYVYISACIQRMMGNSTEKGSVQAAMLRVCQRAGLDIYLPEQLPGHCCGQAFSSKGFQDAATLKQEQLIDALWQWTQQGHLPVVMDFTSCTYTLLHAGSHLSPAYREKLNQLIIMDAITFLDKVVAPNLPAIRKKDQVVIHPGCAATKMQLEETMYKLAGRYATKVLLPPSAGCCGMAGDRGFLFPELTESATKAELSEALLQPADGYYASAKTCEMALSHFSGKPYEHIVYLLDEVTG
jgi:D-lactate dehydrogenase